MRLAAALGPCLAAAVLLALWRHFHGQAAGTAALAVLAAGGVAGGMRMHLAVRRAILSTAIEAESWVRPWLTGRIPALVASGWRTALALPGLAYAAAFGSRAEIALVLLCILGVALLCAGAGGAVSRHVRPAFRPSALRPAALLWGGAVAVAHAAILYNAPVPEYLAAGGIMDIAAAATAEIAAGPVILAEVLAALRLAEAAGYWIVIHDRAPSLALWVFLAQGAVIQIGVAGMAMDLQILMNPALRPPR